MPWQGKPSSYKRHGSLRFLQSSRPWVRPAASSSRWVRRLLFVAAGLAALALVSLTGYLVFQPDGADQRDDLRLTWQGPRRVTAGEEVTYRLQASSASAAGLTNLELTLEFPPEFRLLGADRTALNQRQTVWRFDDLPAFGSATLSLTGVFVAKSEQPRLFRARLGYRPANFPADFQVSGEYQVEVTRQLGELSWRAPAQFLAGQPLRLTLRYRNSGSEILPASRIAITLPPSMTVAQRSPETSGLLWVLPELPPDGAEEITLTTAAPPAELSRLPLLAGWERDVEMKLETRNVKQGSSGGDLTPVPIAETTFTVQLVQPELDWQLTVDGQPAATGLRPGQEQRYALQLRNDGRGSLEQLSINATFAAGDADWSSWKADSGEGELGSAPLQWQADLRNVIWPIGTLAPGQVATASWKLKSAATARSLSLHASLISQSLRMSAADGSDAAWQAVQEFSIGQQQPLRISSQARFYDESGRPLGNGPLPPVVGQTTAYRVVWSAANLPPSLRPAGGGTTAGEVDVNAAVGAGFKPARTAYVLRGSLPSGAEWAGAQRGNVSYDSVTREARWQFSAGDLLTAEFAVRLTPTAEQAGRVAALVGPVQLALDGGSEILASAGEATTDLAGDPFGQGKGIVQP